MAEFITNCGFVPTLGGTTDWVYSSAVAGYQNPTNANPVCSVHDFGGTQAVSSGTFTAAMPVAAASTAILRIT